MNNTPNTRQMQFTLLRTMARNSVDKDQTCPVRLGSELLISCKKYCSGRQGADSRSEGGSVSHDGCLQSSTGDGGGANVRRAAAEVHQQARQHRLLRSSQVFTPLHGPMVPGQHSIAAG